MLVRYCAGARKEYGDAILHTVIYLNEMHHVGLKFKTVASEGFGNFADVDFSGNRNAKLAVQDDPNTAKSYSGWAMFYAGFPIIWSPKLQSRVA